MEPFLKLKSPKPFNHGSVMPNHTIQKLSPILLVEDDDTDVELVKRTLDKKGLSNPFYRACDGIEALEILEREKLLTKFPQPILIVLDINMPRMNGFEFLKAIRSNDQMQKCLVFILTTSTRDADLQTSYQHNVAGYFRKNNTKGLIEILSLYSEVNEFSDNL